MPGTRKKSIAAVAAVVAVAAVIVAVVLWPGGDDHTASAPPESPGSTPPPAVATTTSAAPDTEEPATTHVTEGVVPIPQSTFLIASPATDIQGYGEPGGEPTGTVSATWHDRPSHLAVIDQTPGWLQVRLPQRPNGSTTWVRIGDVELSTTPYRIEVDVGEMRLRLYDEGEVVLDAPAGVGTDAAPTAVGNFFVAFFQEPLDSNPGWGPFMLVTSAHSETISDYQSSGDAIAAIHGPLGSAEAIGTTGAKVSHGCVRLHIEDLLALRDVPAGSPVDIVDSGTST